MHHVLRAVLVIIASLISPASQSGNEEILSGQYTIQYTMQQNSDITDHNLNHGCVSSKLGSLGVCSNVTAWAINL